MITVYIRGHLFPFFVMITDRSILIITWRGDLLPSRWPFGPGDRLGVEPATWEDRIDYDPCMGLHAITCLYKARGHGSLARHCKLVCVRSDLASEPGAAITCSYKARGPG